eukprot:TRINITY_DN24694_c0_g1_i5.p1 TRINITY_DN24694_c0_g1~~TRINITY_DN24694_c0_g1_i5.p1  ORF type:complete len:391 (+),score=81.33 TRINITY_DN24694_c0_g1_i5:43-1215(+)
MQCSEALAKAFRCAVRSVCQSEPGAYNKTAHEYGLQGPNDWHPAFYGCWDWHSAVHSHFLILRCLRRYQLDEEDKERAWEALRQHLRRDKIAVEVESLQKENPGWECPYGLAWVLALAAEAAVAVRDFSARRGFGDWAKWASGMHAALVPLETAAVRRLDIWLDEIIADPQEMLNRSGLHGNSAFCLRLALEHKAVVGRQKGLPIHKLSQAVELVGKHRGDVVADGHPFLSPFLADVGLALKARQLFGHSPNDFCVWKSEHTDALLRLQPVMGDPDDMRTCHALGLNFSRAEGLCHAILLRLTCPGSTGDCLKGLHAAAQDHFSTSAKFLDSGGFMADHWIGTFALLAEEAFAEVARLWPPRSRPSSSKKRPATHRACLVDDYIVFHKQR